MSQKYDKKFILRNIFPSYNEHQKQKQHSLRAMNKQDKRIDLKFQKIINDIGRENYTYEHQKIVEVSDEDDEQQFERKAKKIHSKSEKSLLKKRSNLSHREKSSKKLSSKKHNLSLPKIPNIKKSAKVELSKKENQLGQLIFKKVERYFDDEKCKERKFHYYDKIKSEENIDDSLIEYLRIKVQKANAMLRKNK